jgi:hypothetical protein
MEFSSFIFNVVTSQSGWSGAFYLVLGAILGLAVSVAANRPRLSISGAMGNFDWVIKNQPKFMGRRIDGKAAKDLHAIFRSEDIPQAVGIRWKDEPPGTRITIEPGANHILTLPLKLEGDGYCLFDGQGTQIVQYTPESSRVFLLTIHDRFSNRTVIKFDVQYLHDKAILGSKPQLKVHSSSLWRRRHMTDAWRHIRRAVRLR